ncbi:S46 family peptidase [Flexithrix dorotheae]|uniref:S46 family peptidase n=1 Tax=Flexithrix dorotheae TaxID=70993 RepID=UPI000373FD2F|nr:S46 family peptidase [Flexithrix dorotheae]
MIKKILFLVLFSITSFFPAIADEGMWLPLLLQQLNAEQLQTNGFKLTPEDIYSVNQSSLKDAVLQFGGGCTGVVVSPEGLLLTNHHCGYGRIQSHSSLENDYLTDGFWAMNKEEELSNPGLTITFIVRMEDVTSKVLAGVNDQMEENQRNGIILRNTQQIKEEATAGSHYGAIIKEFFYGNQYFMFITETFKDIRLVGAPPSSIGKFGADTDNWVWPRHTGDFSVFRIYADADNKPASYSPDNVPYKPKHFLPIGMNGVKQGDPSLIFGFPGSTQQFLPSFAVEFITDEVNPLRIKMREASLSIIDAAMKADDEIRIKYAARQSSISNAYKKWIGENLGLKRKNAYEKKLEFESRFKGLANTKNQEYLKILEDLKVNHEAQKKYTLARDLFREFIFYGPQLIRFASDFNNIAINHAQLEKDKAVEAEVEKLKQKTRGHFKNYDKELDQEIFASLMEIYLEEINPEFKSELQALIASKYDNDPEVFASKLYEKTMFADEQKTNDLLINFSASSIKKISKDPAFSVMRTLFISFQTQIEPEYFRLAEEKDKLMREYVKAIQTLIPDKNYWPDANLTLRVGFGKVEGSSPHDGMLYEYQTTLEGVMQKRNPDHKPTEEFYVPDKLVELYEQKDYGPYGENGKMPVCFTASNHTTGGNSGSPIIDAEGKLIGLNFDRSWESTMSDIMYDPDICRNIVVDIRYVLFIIDKYAGAKHLVEEMSLAN